MGRFRREVKHILSKICMLQQRKQQMLGEREIETAARKGFLAHIEEILEHLHRRIKASLNRLGETNPLTEVDYIELLIECETQQCENGYQERIQCYEEVKKHAVECIDQTPYKQQQDFFETAKLCHFHSDSA